MFGIADIEVKESSEGLKPKLYATLYVQGKDDVQQVKIYEWNLNKQVPNEGNNTEDWLNSLLLSKEVSIEADVSYSGDDLTAVRIKIKTKNMFTVKEEEFTKKK